MLSKDVSSTILKVFGMTRPGNEPVSPGSLANTDADFADNLVLLANTTAQTESLLHSQVQAVRGIGLNVYSDEIEFICLN